MTIHCAEWGLLLVMAAARVPVSHGHLTHLPKAAPAKVALKQANIALVGVPSLLYKGQTRAFSVVGARAAAAVVESSDEQVVKVTKASGGYRIQAIGAGQANVTAVADGEAHVTPVIVRAYAAMFPQSLRADVVGEPAAAETVRGAIEYAVQTQAEVEPGVNVKIVDVHPCSLAPGDAHDFSARVRAYGQGFMTGEGIVTIKVHNLDLPPKRETELWFSDNPEKLEGVGPLFASKLSSDAPVRVLFHHINDTKDLLFLKLQAVNDSDQAAQLVVTPGGSPPDMNPVRAGIRAADEFVRGWQTNSGEVVNLPPHTSLPIALRSLAPQQTESGLCALRLLPGGPDSLLIREDVSPPFPVPGRWGEAVAWSAPWRAVGATKILDWHLPPSPDTQEIYPNPYQEVEATYAAGSKATFIRIGEEALAARDATRHLDGDYGVVYNVHAVMNNPNAVPEDVEFVFEASGGYSGALVVLDGLVLQTPLLQPHCEYRLRKYHLLPGESKEIRFSTVPLSGSSYPCTFDLRQVGSKESYGNLPGMKWSPKK